MAECMKMCSLIGRYLFIELPNRYVVVVEIGAHTIIGYEL